MYEVMYIINETGVRVTQKCYSEYEANQLVNKLKHSTKCTYVSMVKYF